MNIKKVTSLVIILTIILLGLFDAFAIYQGGTAASISHTIVEWSYNYPAFTFAFGFLCGHFFWRVRGTSKLREIVDSTRSNK